MALTYDPALFGKYYVLRFALLYPLSLTLVILTLAQRREAVGSPALDVLDLLALAFAAWQALSAVLSPAPVVAWLGYYNRGSGALFWTALALLFLAARRLLDDARGRQALTWAASLVLLIAGAIALAQNAGASGLWGGAAVNGRVAGPTGNPINLAGLGLLGVWLAAGLPSWPRRCATQVLALAGAAAGAVCVILSVSRAAYVGIAAAAAVLAVAWLLEHRRRALLVLACVCAAGLVATVGYGLTAGAGASLLSRLSGEAGGLTHSDVQRVALWREALDGLAWRPLSGAGSGAFAVVDRRFSTAQDHPQRPWAFASDPHSLPLLVASTSGLPGLLLALAFAVLLAGTSWPRGRASPAAEANEKSAAVALRLAGLSYLAASAVYLLVSPLDPVIAVPAVLVAAATCGAPRLGQRFSWRPAERSWPSWGRPLTALAALLAGAALAAAVVGGVQWYRADRAFAQALPAASPAGLARAATLWSWEPFYALQAGAETWRAGLVAQDVAGVARGRALVQQGLAHDPTGGLGYADLARLDLAQGRLTAAVAELRAGLRWNPQQPVLEGLWGYAALLAQTKLKDAALAGSLLAGLQALPANTPDAWFWISRVLAARGDQAAAGAARARARRLAPSLGSWRYRQRLLQAR